MVAQKSSVFKMNFDIKDKQSTQIPNRRTFKRLFKDLTPFMPHTVLFVIISLFYAYTFVEIPRILGEAIDIFVSAVISSVIKDSFDINISALTQLIPAAAILLPANTFFSVLQGIISTDISSGYSDSLRKKVFKKIGCVRMAYFDRYSKEYVLSLATEKTDGITQSLNILLSRVLSSVILSTAITLMIFKADLIVGLFVCIAFIIQFIVAYAVKKADDKFSEKIYKNKNTTDIFEIYQNLESIRLSGKVQTVLSDIKIDEKNKAPKICRARFISFIRSNSTDLIIGCVIAATVLLEYTRINESVITIGTLLSIIIYLRKLSSPLSQITAFGDSADTVLSCADALFAFIDEKSENISAECKNAQNDNCKITVDNISFRYSEGTEYIFKNFSTEIEPRGITTIRGLTGSGKSTLIKLILGMYEPEAGEILFGKQKIREQNIRKYRENFFLVTQEATLFEKDIAQNIAYPESASQSNRIMTAAQTACAAEFIDKLPEKYETVFNRDSSALSDGQVQQILLARALYHNKQFIVLDESTSFIDTENEAEIYRILKKISNNCGIIIITHKNSNTVYADKIIEI